MAQQHTYAQALSADVSFLNRRSFVTDKVQEARIKCANMLGLSNSDQLAFVRNTSEANAVIVNGLDLNSSDEVLLWDQNHATNYQSWHYRHTQPNQLKPKFQCRTFSVPQDIASVDLAVDSFLQKITKNTRVVSFSHLSNISGLRLPAREICAAIHAKNPDIFIHLDGAQSWGSMAVDLDEIGCDSFSASGHKWLCGPRGSGILMVNNKWASRIKPLINAYDFYYDYPEDKLPDNALRFENTGQRDTAMYGALGDTVDIHESIGLNRIEERIQNLTAYGLNAFDQAGIQTITPTEKQFGHGVLVADVGGKWKSYAAFLALHNAGIAAAFTHGNTVHCSANGLKKDDTTNVYLRICPHIYNTTDDLDAAIAIAKRIKNSNFEIVKEIVRFL